MLLAAVAFSSSALIYLVVPDQKPTFTASWGSTFSILGSIYRDPRFWRLAPLSTFCVGTSWALQGLWAAQWLADVERMQQPIVVRHLLTMAIAVCTGALLFGIGADQLRRRGVAPKNVLAVVAVVFVTVQVGLVQRWPISSYLVWAIVAAVGAATVLSFAILNEYFPKEIAGQANGALNLIHLTGAFALQAGIGVVIEQWARHDGHYPLAAYQCALSLSVALQVAALAWYVRPEGSAWRERWLAEAKWLFRASRPGIAGGHAIAGDDEALIAYAKAQGWRRIALGSAFLSALLAAIVITKDSGAGAVSGTERLPAANAPFDARAAYVLETFVAGVRSLSIDPVVVRARWLAAYDLTTDKGAQAVDDILQRTRSFASIGARPIIVEMTSVRQVVGDIFEARWTEHIYERSRLVGSEHFIGRLTMVPKNASAVESLRNPMGIFVDGFAWSREADSTRQRAP
jgi:type IV secretory pathway TrbF-like protein